MCLRSLRGEREFAQALFFERVREATDSHDVLQPQEDQAEGGVVEGVAAELALPAVAAERQRIGHLMNKAYLGEPIINNGSLFRAVVLHPEPRRLAGVHVSLRLVGLHRF